MKVMYYFASNRPKKEKAVVESIYGNDILYIDEIKHEIMEAGDYLICNSVDELTCFDNAEDNIDDIIKTYTSLYLRDVEVVFDKSTQCNSLFIKTLTHSNNEFLDILRKCVLNWFNQKSIQIKYSKKHYATATKNGNKLGIKKGTKLTTKKSIEMKNKIKQFAKDFDGDFGDEELIKKLGISRNSYYKYKKELKDGGN